MSDHDQVRPVHRRVLAWAVPAAWALGCLVAGGLTAVGLGLVSDGASRLAAGPGGAVVVTAAAAALGARSRRGAGRRGTVAGAAIAVAAIGAVGVVQAARLGSGTRSAEAVPVGRATDTRALRFQPVLRFDSDDADRPIEVEALLTAPPDGAAAVRACKRRAFRPDECEPVDAPERIPANADDLAIDTATTAGADGAVYVDVRSRGGRTYLGYWWFFLSNRGPDRGDAPCLMALAVREWPCFDHDGDWEGVTVVLDASDAPLGVIYAAHRTISFVAWSRLRDAGALDGARPRVYVASGSHASYPTACASRCTRADRRWGRAIAEGRHDGATEWPGPPARALPSSANGAAASWNAFAGRWGRRRCSLPGICARSDGPRSPSRQPRYRAPWDLDGDALA